MPTGGRVVAGSVTTTVNGAQMILNQASRAAIMNWQQFSIAPNERVRILQSGDAAMLARVTGGDPSALLGQLKADGRLFLVNPRGIVVGPNAVIDTGGFMASTLDVSDQDFLAGGPLRFKGASDAAVVNLGRITAREGNVLLVAHTVRNAGEIAAPKGAAALAAAAEVYLASPDARGIVVKANLPAAADTVGVENSGLIAAAQAQLEAAGGSIYDLAVNQTGIVRATGVEHLPDGRVVITAGGGTIGVGGTVGARNADGSGGTILVGGGFQGKDPSVANAARTVVLRDALLDASAESGDGGRVIVWADDTTRHFGRIEAKGGAGGGNGGFAEVSGKRSLVITGTADLTAPAGEPGTLLLDPEVLRIVAGTTTPLPSGLETQPFIWGMNDPPATPSLGAASLVTLLGMGHVTLQASDRIWVEAPIIVPNGTNDLSLTASDIRILESIDLGAGDLQLFDWRFGPGSRILNSAANATLKASRIDIGDFLVTALNGPVVTSSLRYFNIDGQADRFVATNGANRISAFSVSTDPADPYPVAFAGGVAVASATPMDVSPLLSAKSVDLSAQGDLKVLGPAGIETTDFTRFVAANGGVFINEAGGGVLAGPGRRLIYTSSTGGAFSLGGMTGFVTSTGVFWPNDPLSGSPRVVYDATFSIGGVDPSMLQTFTIDPNFQLTFTPGEKDKKLEDFFKVEQTPVVAGLKAGAQITPKIIGDAIRDFGAGFRNDIAAALKDKSITDGLSKEELAILEQVAGGKLSLADLASRAQSDLTVRAAIIPVLGRSLENALKSGRPLSEAQQSLASRVAENINTYRKVYAQKLEDEYARFIKEKGEVGANNPFAFKTMADIAQTAQQAATEQAIAGALGVGGGIVAGALTATGIILGAKVLLPFAGAAAAAAAKAAALAGTGATSAGAAGAAGASGVAAGAAAGAFVTAVAAVAIGVVAVVMLVQEQKNKDAYNEAQARANRRVDLSLKGFDLNDSKNRSEFATAFAMTMLETGF